MTAAYTAIKVLCITVALLITASMTEVTLAQIKDLLSQANKVQSEELLKEIKADVTQQLKESNERIEKLENKYLFYERKLRKNNIIIFGLDNVDNTDLVRYTLGRINEVLDLNFSDSDINNVYKIGRSEKPPVIVEFISYLKKIEVFRDIDKLRSLKGKNISISNDLCKVDREIQNTLRKHLNIARGQNQQARLKGNRLEIEGKLYTVSDLEGEAETDSSSDTDSDTSPGDDLNVNIEAAQNTIADDGQRTAESLRTKKKKKKSKKRKIAEIKTPSPQNVRTTRSHKKKRNSRF